MKLRILSDIHIEFNDNNKIPIYKKDNVLTIIAGDISTSPNTTSNYLDSNFSKCIFIEGNHILNNNKKESIYKIYKWYRQKYPVSNNITFLQNNYKIIDDIVFIGATMWTNYLYKNNTKKEAKKLCQEYLSISPTGNGYYNNFLKIKKHVDINFFTKEYKKSCKFITKIIKKFKDKKIVLITHHPITDLSIVKKYQNWKYISSTVTNFYDQLKEYANITTIIHGHVHQSWNYKINNVNVYCNPLGMKDENDNFKKEFVVEV